MFDREPRPVTMTGLQYKQVTPLGTVCYSEAGISAERLRIVDEKIKWCIDQGLKGTPQSITIFLKDGTVEKNGGTWIEDFDEPNPIYNGRLIGGRVVSFNPIAILVMPRQLGCIRHELLHIYFRQQTGDYDTNHTKPEWRVWPTYEDT